MTPEGGDFDHRLERLFEEAREPLAGEAFQAEIERQLRITRRGSLVLQIIMHVLLFGSLVAATPLIVNETLHLSGYVSEAVSGLGAALLAPSGWVASVLLALWAMRRWRFSER